MNASSACATLIDATQQLSPAHRAGIGVLIGAENNSALGSGVQGEHKSDADLQRSVMIQSSTSAPRAKMEVKAEDVEGERRAALRDALAANADQNAAMNAAARAAAVAAATNAYHENPHSFVAAARHLTARAEQNSASASSTRVKPEAVSGDAANFRRCTSCTRSVRRDAVYSTCERCLTRKRTTRKTSKSKCDELHFAHIADGYKYIETLDDCEYAYYINGHKGDRQNRGNGATETNLRVRLVCHCYYKPSKEQEAQNKTLSASTPRLFIPFSLTSCARNFCEILDPK